MAIAVFFGMVSHSKNGMINVVRPYRKDGTQLDGKTMSMKLNAKVNSKAVVPASVAVPATKPNGVDYSAVLAEIAALKAQNEALQAKVRTTEKKPMDHVIVIGDEKGSTVATLSLRCTEKGGLSVYGLGRFPVTLYRQQWEVLSAGITEIDKFINKNAKRLPYKGE